MSDIKTQVNGARTLIFGIDGTTGWARIIDLLTPAQKDRLAGRSPLGALFMNTSGMSIADNGNPAAEDIITLATETEIRSTGVLKLFVRNGSTKLIVHIS